MGRSQYISPVVLFLSLLALPASALTYDEIVLLVQAERRVFGKSDNSSSFDERIQSLELNALGVQGSGSDTQRLKAVCRKLGMLPPEPAVGRNPGIKPVSKKSAQERNELDWKKSKQHETERLKAEQLKAEQLKAEQLKVVQLKADKSKMEAQQKNDQQLQNKPKEAEQLSLQQQHLHLAASNSPKAHRVSNGGSQESSAINPAILLIGLVLGLLALTVGFVIYLFAKAGSNSGSSSRQNDFQVETLRTIPHRHRPQIQTNSNRTSQPAQEPTIPAPPAQEPVATASFPPVQKPPTQQALTTTPGPAAQTSQVPQAQQSAPNPLSTAPVQHNISKDLSNLPPKSSGMYWTCEVCGRPFSGSACLSCTQVPIGIEGFGNEALFTEDRHKQVLTPEISTLNPPQPQQAAAQTESTTLSDLLIQQAQASKPALRSHVCPPQGNSIPKAAVVPSSLHSYMKQVPERSTKADIGNTAKSEEASAEIRANIKTVQDFRQEQQKKTLQFKVCPECDASYSQEAKFCINDGQSLQLSEMDQAVAFAFAERYELESVIASGGMSVLYQARHKMLNREVAIKVMDARLVRNSSLVKRFQREAQMICKMNHPNVIVVHDFGTTSSGQPYIVMDFLAGKTLSRILAEETQLPCPRAKNIFLQVASGLGHAHQIGVIHRDVKPTNIIVHTTEFGGDQVTIVDFGIAKMGAESKIIREKLTQFGELFGTTLYMSPEQCRGLDVDLRTDIYSLGCVMFEVLCGRPPFNTGDDFEMRQMIVSASPPALCELRPDIDIPQGCEAVLKKTLEKDPQTRYQSMDELICDLARIPD